MKTTQLIGIALTAALFASTGLAQSGAGPSVKAFPPSVVKTTPQAGDTTVDPDLKEITVTYSKDMLTEKMWAVCEATKATAPEIVNSEIHYQADKRTCVVPVKLQPGRTYALWFNQGNRDYFRDAQGHPSMPYLLVFETKK